VSIVIGGNQKMIYAKEISKIIVNHCPRFGTRRNFCIVPNVSWGLLDWEADLIVCTKSGYLTEIEIKISMSDWKQDNKKYKFKFIPGYYTKCWEKIKYFYYAAPNEIASRYKEINLPDFAGVMSVSLINNRVEILKEAIKRKSRKLSNAEMMQLARLGTMRIWG